jgi:hypothetical protein
LPGRLRGMMNANAFTIAWTIHLVARWAFFSSESHTMTKFTFLPIVTLVAAFSLLPRSNANAEDLYLTDGSAFPGQLWLSEGGTAERSILRRETRANAAYPTAIMKLSQATVGPEGHVYYCSGLDGHVMHLLEGRNEVLSFEFAGQVRDLASTGEEHTVYFSVVPTPQDGERLADGKIYRRDLWDGAPSEVLTVRQDDVGGNWWGTFTIKDGVVYIATLGDNARIYRVTGRGAELAFETRVRIDGLTTGPDGDFYFVGGDRKVYRTRDFERFETALETDRRLTDVTLRAAREGVRP